MGITCSKSVSIKQEESTTNSSMLVKVCQLLCPNSSLWHDFYGYEWTTLSSPSLNMLSRKTINIDNVMIFVISEKKQFMFSFRRQKFVTIFFVFLFILLEKNQKLETFLLSERPVESKRFLWNKIQQDEWLRPEVLHHIFFQKKARICCYQGEGRPTEK
jgi:hypothetical protein